MLSPDKRGRVPERVFRDDSILCLTNDRADTRLVIRIAEEIVDGREGSVFLLVFSRALLWPSSGNIILDEMG